jgi:hypothetical protein
VKFKTDHNFISAEDLEKIVFSILGVLKIKIDFPAFKKELERLSRKFLENSYATCFSETNNDFLMWAHYSSKHAGICLEFTLEQSGLFPFRRTGNRKPDQEKYLKRASKWSIDEFINWDALIRVNYQEEQPYINFFDFWPVFKNEHDCDLMGLSKTWTHPYTHKLEKVFSFKTKSWEYEKEWRNIEIHFGDIQEPEERIRHFPIECLTSIYFGIRTPEEAKKRIYKIFKSLKRELQYFDCKLTSGRDLAFEKWKYYDE